MTHTGQHDRDCRICVGINERDRITYIADRLRITPEEVKVMIAGPKLLEALEEVYRWRDKHATYILPGPWFSTPVPPSSSRHRPPYRPEPQTRSRFVAVCHHVMSLPIIRPHVEGYASREENDDTARDKARN